MFQKTPFATSYICMYICRVEKNQATTVEQPCEDVKWLKLQQGCCGFWWLRGYDIYDVAEGTSIWMNENLVGGFNPFEKYDRQIGSPPQVGVKIKKSLKPPPRASTKVKESVQKKQTTNPAPHCPWVHGCIRYLQASSLYRSVGHSWDSVTT